MESIAHRLEQVQESLHVAARRSGRDPAGVTLVAVTKTRPAETVVAAAHCGLRHFGENRVEEAKAKIPRVQESLAHSDLHPIWHMIGHLQRRKVRDAVALFDRIHSVDRLAAARELSKRCVTAGKTLPVLLEVNISGEKQKYGFSVRGGVVHREDLEAFCRDVDQIAALPGITIQGLMTMAPLTVDAEQTRPVFRALRMLRDEMGKRFPAIVWDDLSMGMTNDFEVAVEEGATIVRIGTAIFGPRNATAK
ncbi:MAG: YggS family pyridoxal phosphate-dependent enzyme [Chloroflexi bacterium]|nr:YggS family pyridoxal phosphate-dependent enzyme [Chloroflexota bacterium]